MVRKVVKLHELNASKFRTLIHSGDPQSQPIVITVFTHVRLSPHSKSNKTKQLSSENNVCYWRDCESGRVDHWWHLYCVNYLLQGSEWSKFMFSSIQLPSSFISLCGAMCQRNHRLCKMFVLDGKTCYFGNPNLGDQNYVQSAKRLPCFLARNETEGEQKKNRADRPIRYRLNRWSLFLRVVSVRPSEKQKPYNAT